MKHSLLFICLGNICRSPAAEGVMRQMAERRRLGDSIVVDSAGIGAWHVGEQPDHRMCSHARKRGYDLTTLRARQFSSADFDHFDLIIGMDQENLRAIRAKARNKEDEQKIRLMADYLRHNPSHPTIPDPYYGSDRDFELVIELLEDACEGLLDSF